MKKVLFRILIICIAICCVLGIFTACDENGVIDNDNNGQMENPIDEKDNECQHEYSETIVNPTCTEQGYTLHACKKCSHNYKDNFTDALGHDYIWTTTKQPTETTKGTETGVCSRCQDTITRDIPELNHEHSYTETIVAPTCTAKGYTLHKCSCGYEYRTDETEKIPHTPAAAVEENRIEPKCEESGSYDLVVRCSVCGEELEKEHKTIEKRGHNYGEWYEAKAPSCTEEGELRRVCNNDPTHIETMAIAATGHSFSKDWTTDSGYHWHASACGHNVISERGAHEYKIDVVPVTCETDGYTLHTCTTCGYSYKDNIIPTTGHAFSSEWTTDSTYHWHTATCGHDLINGKAAHNFGAATTVVPSCDSDGYDYKTCSTCGYEYRYNIVPALGHIKSGVKVKTLVKASDSGYGYYTTEFYCERCQKVNSTQYTMIQPSGATVNSARGEWEENTVFSNVPYPENGVCTSLITSTENTAVGSYKGTVGAFFDNITRAQVKSYTQTLKNKGYNKAVTEYDYSAYSFTAYHNTLNIFIAVGYDGSEMSIAVYKTGTVKKADNSGSGSSGGTVLHDITATAGLSYSLSDDGKSYSVDGYSGTEDYVVIPYKVNGLPVKSIGGFTGNTQIKAVIILAEIEIIEEIAFSGCSNMKYITIPDNIIFIGDNAFYKCNNLQLKGYNNGLYLGNEHNPYVVLLKTNSKDITSCVIHENAKCIYGAFNGCKKLTAIEIPYGVRSIGEFAFYECINLTSITIPNSVVNIGRDAFYYNKFTSINIPYGVTSIDKYAFDSCINLLSICLPNSVISIGEYAFMNCSSLTSISIPDSVIFIGESAFPSTFEFTNINVDEKNNYYKSVEGNLYNKDGTVLIRYASGKKDISFIIPNNVTIIDAYAFDRCCFLEQITIPDSVTSIGYKVFSGCNSLTSVYYNATAADWAKISINSSGNNNLTSATRYYYSETEPKLNEQGTAYNGNYWHYVNDEIVIWTKEN